MEGGVEVQANLRQVPRRRSRSLGMVGKTKYHCIHRGDIIVSSIPVPTREWQPEKRSGKLDLPSERKDQKKTESAIAPRHRRFMAALVRT